MNLLNINKLNKTNNKMYELRIKTYEQVRKQCYNRINIISETGKLDCWYAVPPIITGTPPINIEECAIYLKNKLDYEPILYEFLSSIHPNVSIQLDFPPLFH